MPTLASKPYIGTRVTLTNANQNYNLLALLVAVYGDFPGHANQVNIRPITNPLFVGDSTMGATSEGDQIPAAQLKTYGPYHTSVFPLGSIYLRTGTAGSTVDVEVISVENGG